MLANRVYVAGIVIAPRLFKLRIIATNSIVGRGRSVLLLNVLAKRCLRIDPVHTEVQHPLGPTLSEGVANASQRYRPLDRHGS